MLSACRSNFQSRKYTGGIYLSAVKKKNKVNEQSKILASKSIVKNQNKIVNEKTLNTTNPKDETTPIINDQVSEIPVNYPVNTKLSIAKPVTPIQNPMISFETKLVYKNLINKKSFQKNSNLDFFDGVIGFLYLVMFVIFTAMYFILIIGTYASMPLVIALGLAMLFSLLTCITGQFIQV